MTKNEFHAYMLAYAVQADFKVTPGERAFILSKIPEELYLKVNRVLERDSDYEAIQRILSNAEVHYGDEKDPDKILAEVKEAMMSDGEMDATETAAFVGLRRLLKSS